MFGSTKRKFLSRRILGIAKATVEKLENRRLLAAITWDGGGDGVNWTNALNWSTDVLPGPDDDATINIAANPTIQLNVAGLQSIRSLVCAEGLQISNSAELRLAVASSITGSFTLSGNGTLSGTGDLTLAGPSTWSGGTMSGAGRTIVPAGQTMTLSGAKVLSRPLEVAGTANHNATGNPQLTFGDNTGADGTLLILTGGVFNFDGGVFVFSDPQPGHAIVNNGTINRTGAGSSTQINPGTLTITNNGAINVAEGTLATNGNATLINNGAINISAGAQALLRGASTYNAGSTFTGAGRVDFQGNAQHTFAPAAFTVSGPVSTEGGSATLEFGGNVTLSTLALGGGQIIGAGDLTVTGALTWTRGDMAGTGKIVIPAGATLNITDSGPKSIARQIDLAGNATYSGDGLRFGDSSPAGNGTLNILAGATFDMTGEQFVFSFGGTAHAVNNFGTINRSGVGTTTKIHAGSILTVTNHGTINVNSGALDVKNPALLNHGTFNVAAGAFVRFGAGGSTHNAGSIFGGAGAVSLQSAGTHTFAPGTFALAGPLALENGSPTVNFNGNVTLTSLTHAGGSIGGSGEVIVDGTYNWTSGDLVGTGRSIVPLGRSVTLSGTAAKSIARRFDLSGTATYDGDSLRFGTVAGTTGILNVLVGGTFNFTGDGDIFAFDGTGHQFNNAGTVNRSGPGTTAFGANAPFTFNNSGAVNVNAGTFNLNTASNVGSGGFLGGGRYVVASGATLDFQGNGLNTLTADIEIHGTAAVPDLALLKINRGRIGLEAGADLTVNPATQPHVLEGILDLSPDSLFTVNGNMTFAGTSQPIIRTEIASAASFGKVIINGNLDLNSPDSTSRFDPDLIGAFDPPSGTVFNTIEATTVANAFDSFFGGVTPSNLILLLTRPNDQTVAVEIGTGTPPPAPQILDAQFDFETREALVFTFDQNVSAFLARKDFRIENLTTGQTIPQTTGLLTYNHASNQATLLLTHQLPDGNYRLTIQASDIANPAGVPATDGITFDFHVLKGDANRDKRVNLSDFNILAANFGQSSRTFSTGDFNYDGQANLADFNILAGRFGQAITAPASGGYGNPLDDLLA
jgi:hypothetical protein